MDILSQLRRDQLFEALFDSIPSKNDNYEFMDALLLAGAYMTPKQRVEGSVLFAACGVDRPRKFAYFMQKGALESHPRMKEKLTDLMKMSLFICKKVQIENNPLMDNLL